MIACYQLKLNSQWVQNFSGHTMIQFRLCEMVQLSQYPTDHIVAIYVFNKNYVVSIPSSDDLDNHDVVILNDIICYTDGSKHNGRE